MGLAGNLFTARQDRFDTSQRNGYHSTFVSVNGSSDDVVDNLTELIDLRITLGFANLLNDHLLGRLGSDATDHFFVVQFFLTTATGNLT